MTSAGSAAGIDLLLHLVRKDYGAHSRTCSRGGWSCHRIVTVGNLNSSSSRSRCRTNDRIASVADWMALNLNEEITVEGDAARRNECAPHMGVSPSSDVIAFFELQLVILASRFEPCSRPGGFPTSSNSHTVAVFCNGCTKIPISSGKGSGGRDPSSHRRLRPYLTSVRPAWIFQD